MKPAELRYWAASQAAVRCQNALNEQGISIAVTIDPKEVAESVAAIGKPYLTPVLDPERNDFNEANFFWLIASRDEVPVIVGGGRLDELACNVGTHMAQGLNRAYGSGTVSSINPEVDAQLSGRVCYLGDLFSKSGKGLARSSRKCFLGIANFISAVHFRADCTYSFMRVSDVMRGSADVNGFDRRIYDPLTWGVVPDARNATELIVYRNSTSDLDYFNHITRELEQRE
ncbi:hypothetical protein [Tritonibacter mobilis]|uniref:hypothetical protein n=1 Tax=Tritonibacter mobilis TaxID=379347 RepID=UPI001C08B7E3|nr:hypothetical protein [Tritonibacter mobilis]MBU3035955.1 hypothetical protein [Tritonibacter mobilis]WHQ85373.1 hypothetical protein OMR53_21845 [Tritonibacter mobilis]